MLLTWYVPLVKVCFNFPKNPQACGSGRDAVWIAARPNWSVIAIDKDPVLLDKVQQLARREGVARVSLQQVDLEEKPEAVLAPLYGRCHIVHVSRYLHRPLFPLLKAMVAPGGFVLYHTFLRGSEAFGAPKCVRIPGLLLKNSLGNLAICCNPMN